MRDRVLAIVSIITQFILEQNDLLTNENEIVEELLDIGFEADEIDAAFSWMENQTLEPTQPATPCLGVSSQRVFTTREILALSLEARGFLVRLRALGIIDDEMQEEIIERAMTGGEDQVCLKEIKHIAILALFSRAQHQWRKEVDCILDDDWSALYH
ncbi:DUF494 domain-containing protein [Geoalkalibacter halelectricus]|uniref:DUF494 domain-containing protein n=1 Tax=Geoalkalibacter halelectricus TaxID=2847045 RepID=A0ABY5ZU91_9BACT|nr:DUF494 domain-containing protein [Geoalkalibacter halelectricus]MDO3377460.1 DUF494 domain-containing protein [Geoalkalibacter halelectricus]UWZ80781.1 DUF494 domain-containing protein [Geoalkalibacter halelectricus]